ncbi:asparaginase [Halomonas sp.]|uniref:asparaginase n=1 Tax=Halomonas sp. TaxID=1486246 RepID=UPI0035682ACB
MLTTGGTIASMPGGSGLNISGAMSGESLLERVALPEPDLLDVEVRSILQKPSNAISLVDLVEMSRHCERLAKDPDINGIVVTHGTDTLEETAHFLDVTLALSHCALVVTGSQRAPHDEGTDAFRNLANAITVAADSRLAGLGATVVFNECIYAARQVRKLNSYQVNGFGAPGGGQLGYVDGPRVHLAQLPLRMPLLPLGESLPRVDILPAYLDASPELVEASVASGARGLVIDGLGRGHVPPGWLASIENAIKAGITVLVVSSCQEGPVNFSYEFPGSLASLVSLGALVVPDQSARKARLNLAVMLSTPFQDGKEGMARWFQHALSRP